MWSCNIAKLPYGNLKPSVSIKSKKAGRFGNGFSWKRSGKSKGRRVLTYKKVKNHYLDTGILDDLAN